MTNKNKKMTLQKAKELDLDFYEYKDGRYSVAIYGEWTLYSEDNKILASGDWVNSYLNGTYSVEKYGEETLYNEKGEIINDK